MNTFLNVLKKIYNHLICTQHTVEINKATENSSVTVIKDSIYINVVGNVYINDTSVNLDTHTDAS